MVSLQFGTATGGEYAIVLIFFNLLWSITGLIISVLSPMYYTFYARGLYRSMQDLSVVSIKFVGLVMALPIALICIFSPQLLTIWVGESFAHLSSLIWIFLIPLTMIVSFRPLILNYAALNKVRIPALFTIVAGIFNLILAVLFTAVFNLGVYGITLAFVLALFLRGVVFIPLYAARIQEVPRGIFYKPIVPSVLAYLVLVITGMSMVSVITIPASIVYITLISGFISFLYYFIVTHIILTSGERDLIRSILPPHVSKILPHWVL